MFCQSQQFSSFPIFKFPIFKFPISIFLCLFRYSVSVIPLFISKFIPLFISNIQVSNIQVSNIQVPIFKFQFSIFLCLFRVYFKCLFQYARLYELCRVSNNVWIVMCCNVRKKRRQEKKIHFLALFFALFSTFCFVNHSNFQVFNIQVPIFNISVFTPVFTPVFVPICTSVWIMSNVECRIMCEL